MKNITITKLRQLLGELYWKAHSDGQVAASFGTDFGIAEVTILDSIVRLYPRKRAAYVLRRLAAPPNTASSRRVAGGRKSKSKRQAATRG